MGWIKMKLRVVACRGGGVIDGTGSDTILIMGFVINSDEPTDSATTLLVIKNSRCSIPVKKKNTS
jgi:hypothetical protein